MGEETVVNGQQILVRLDEIARRQKEQARLRKIATWAAVAGALFAAGRLGILAVPFVRKKR